MEIKKDRKYIVRSCEAGVFYGYIAEKDGDEVTMTDARCLWYWSGAASLNQLAIDGVRRPQDCKFTKALAEVTILKVCEIIPCEEKAMRVIDEVAEWSV